MADDKPEIKRGRGQPPKYTSPEDMQRVGDKYFEDTLAKGDPVTVTGLCIALGFTTRQALLNYEAKDEYLDTVKRLKLQCEHYVEQMAWTSRNPAMGIFCLKNFSWSDRTDLALSTPNGPLESRIEIVLKKA